jgi:mono/diheme cytochrome c family protein
MAPPEAEEPIPEGPSCAESTAAAANALEAHCVRCHGPDGPGPGGIADMLDVGELRRLGKVVPGDPLGSRVYVRVRDDTMPPAAVETRTSVEERQAIGAWIRCGAPDFEAPAPVAPGRTFQSVDTILGKIEADLRRITNPAERERMRYVVLSNEWNRATADARLQYLREAVSLLINSLSRGINVVPPESIDDESTIYRIDLDDYAWRARTWDDATEDYPYAYEVDEDSFEYPFDERAQDFIQEATGTDIPYVYADWIVFTASAGERYYDLLDLPGTLQELAFELGVDFEDDARDNDFIRAGFADSGVSVSNRVIQRNAIPGGGWMWSSFDFVDSLGPANIFENPTTFVADGGENIFTLPNGLQGYFIANAAGTRLAAAPQAIVTDPSQPDAAVVAGVSCMGCHDAQGIIPRADELRAHVIATSAGGDEREQVLRTHPTEPELMGYFASDGDAFLDAREEAGVGAFTTQPIVQAALAYDTAVDLPRASAFLGIPEDALRIALDADPNVFSRSLLPLTGPGGTVDREEWEAQFAEVVCALGVGRPICTEATIDASCGCVGGTIDRDGFGF